MDIRDIAAASGYGVGTVSRVINGQPNVSERARTHILKVMHECGYEPNSNARYLKMRAQTPVAAFVMGVGNRLFDDIIGPLQACLAEKDEELAITYLDDNAREVRVAADYQQSRHPKGMVFLGGEPRYFKEAFHEIDVPSVLVTGSAEGLGFENLSSVTIDNVAAARRAVEHLLERGHRRIAIVGGSREESQTSAERLRGAELALAEHGIEFDLERNFEPCAFLEQAGYDATTRLLKRSADLTAIFALGDVIAFGALRAIVDQGRSIPGDVSLVGFDDTALSQFAVPRITTIRQDSALLARRAAELLLAGMREGAAARHVIVPFELVERESVRQLGPSIGDSPQLTDMFDINSLC